MLGSGIVFGGARTNPVVTSRGVRAAALIAVPLFIASLCAAPAYAVTPPPIDDTLLPDSAPPSPPQPTRQREACSSNVAPLLSYPPGTHHSADLEAIWRLTRGSGQRIAVIDTGVDPYARLKDVVAGGDYVSDGDGRQDCDGHGTIVASIIAAAPDPTDPTAFTGLAPEATIISIRQASLKFGPVSDPSSDGFGDVRTLAMAVRTAADMGASVINISSVACSESAPEDGSLGAALAYAVDVKDAVIVTAAGNVGGAGQCPMQNTSQQPTVVSSPAWYDDYVLAVGSVSPTGTPSSFSLRGPWVDIAAPGEQVISVKPAAGSAGTAPISGTSYAGPVVSAAAALVRSRYPRLSARQVISRLEQTARKPASRSDSAVGSGVVDVLAAVSDEVARMTPMRTEQPKPVVRRSGGDRSNAIAVVGASVCLTLVGLATVAMRLRRRRRDATTENVGCE